MDVAGIFLADALEHPFRAGAFDPHVDAAEFRLERGRDALGDRQVDRGVPDHLAFFFRSLDQLRRDGFGRRRLRARGRREYRAERQRGRTLEDVAPRWVPAAGFHGVLRFRRYRCSARQRSGGSVSQTSAPLATAFSVGVTMRNTVPSEVSTM